MREHRIYVGWANGCFIVSSHPNFQKCLEEMVEEMGPPTFVEFRDKNTKYII